ncbi:MAG: prepilin-type N-terminal cleavage/methylation domain-containing protein [Candidatus Omnitrophica bacterium]|nr:prepilin-type N-terminal cleavage/methylation domain-containing protein [Candidatus Omnitrophota bacterium]
MAFLHNHSITQSLNHSARRALTLIELMIAMAILVTITGSTMLMFRGITQTWRSGQLRTERYQQARLLFDLFARELGSCVSQARYPFVGTEEEVFFVSVLAGRSGLVERGYWLSGEHELMCHDDEPADGDYEATGTSEVCGTDVVELNLSYFDGTQWVTAWDDSSPPKAVRVTVTIGAQKPESFETIVYVPTS